MSIFPISLLRSSTPTPAAAVATQGVQLHTQIAQFGIRDEIKLSKEAVSLLLTATKNTLAR